MPELDFSVADVEVERYAVSPALRFHVVAANRSGVAIENLALQCQLRIEPGRRTYHEGEHERLRDLFGDAPRWGKTLKSFLWAIVPASVPVFAESTVFDLVVPCSFDFNVAATKYFHGLKDGEVPLTLLFSGSVFYRDSNDRLQIGQIPWSNEARHRLPVRLWQEMFDRYYPDAVWLQVGRDTFEKLDLLKQQNGLPSLEHALGHLLDGAVGRPMS
ncbi:MAG TPA: DUF6084 family protein [Rhizomicrobium sp.]|jgi:hypothetical protein